MEQIEFLRRTDNRHMQTHIKYKIKEAFRERDDELNRRRESLQMMLTTEELQHEKETANLFRERVLENMQKRLDWIATAKFEKAEAEREFLKLKEIQRQLINCEEMRPRESRKITEETKRVQLMQIAEKRSLQMKEKEIDQIWFEALICLDKEKEKQQQYENHLKKLIASKTVDVLDGQLEHLKYVKEMENEEKKRQHLLNEREKHEDLLRTDLEERYKVDKKIEEGIRQRNELKSTAADKLIKARQVRSSEAKINEMQAIQLQQEAEVLKKNKALEKESSDRYLEYVMDEKLEINYKNQMRDAAFVAHGNRIQINPTNKIPYQKSVR